MNIKRCKKESSVIKITNFTPAQETKVIRIAADCGMRTLQHIDEKGVLRVCGSSILLFMDQAAIFFDQFGAAVLPERGKIIKAN